MNNAEGVIILHSTESTTEWSSLMETTSQASVWRCAKTVHSCRHEAWPRTGSTPSRSTEMARRYLHRLRPDYNGLFKLF